jgi:hypothetical protein
MEGRISRKRHAPLDDNGEPVTIPKRRNVSEQTKKQKSVSTVPSKTAPPKKIAPTKRKPSVEIEEVSEEESFHAGPPRNPRNILEASDGSDDVTTLDLLLQDLHLLHQWTSLTATKMRLK